VEERTLYVATCHLQLPPPQKLLGRRTRHLAGRQRAGLGPELLLLSIYDVHNIYLYTSEEASMNTKLTLRLDDMLIHSAKKYAKNQGKSVSQVVSDYFFVLGHKKKPIVGKRLGSKSAQLYGCLKGTDISGEEYKAHLERKYR
jgi:hypothetical protein